MRTRVSAALAVSLLAVLPTAGCYQGANGTVNSQGPTGNGTDVKVGTLQAQNTTLVADATGSGTAALVMTIVNDGESADALVAAALDSGATGATEGPVAVPAGAAVRLGGPGGEPAIAFSGITQTAGTYAEVTLSFRDAGSTTLPVAIVPAVGYYADYAPTLDVEE